MVRGTQGYAEQADELSKRYEALSIEHKHQALLHLLPPAPARALDIGAASHRAVCLVDWPVSEFELHVP